ncbi:branched-chain amino acid ABC transporter permease [Oligella sp. HMSC09E12]|uniref:branched-chain amino acid ABC transporter permease n=1 Tax=Oligella sp. HMSC09E12 TaxID=1581147 RepID=UPI0008A19265|nr:branched-chain amino acid ABC transporter permease [Oligella sp. HMSC09E12]OFV47841.1 ABC transporter permease [Oligella sp. HMSC09E12]
MNWEIAKILMQDGLVTGVIYALMAVALVLVFAVTRIIFIAQGEFVSFGALTFAIMVNGQTPATIWLLPVFGTLIFLMELYRFLIKRACSALQLLKAALLYLLLPFALALLVPPFLATQPSIWLKALLTLLLIVPLGPMVYRLVFKPVSEAPGLLLLIISIALHFAFVGLGLVFFGAEGWRVSEPFFDGTVEFFGLSWSYQSLFVIAMTVFIIIALYIFFEKTIYGKALRATAVNRKGARLMGISTGLAGYISFWITALIGVVSGILLVSFITITYETGFMIGLKGFVGAIIGGLVSYPIAAVAAVAVGVIEAFSTFWASDYKEVIVFTLILPVLLIRSLTIQKHDEEE